MKYLIQFGHTPALAAREFHQYLDSRKIKAKRYKIGQEILILDASKTIDSKDVCHRLGGVVKVSQQVGRVTKASDLAETISAKLSRETNSKVTFGISSIEYNTDKRKLSQDIKNNLKEKNIASRFVSSEKYGLNPIVIQTQDVREFTIIREDDDLALFETVATSPVLAWQERDRSRPEVDDASGILPPKIARMMVNIATKSRKSDLKVYDPFCGSGTIMSESMYLGYQTFGSDLSDKAVEDTKTNLDYLLEKNLISGEYQLKQGDANDFSFVQEWPRVDALVFEGYLGPTRFDFKEIPSIEDELIELYRRVIPNFKPLLNKKARIVCALPSIVAGNPDKMEKAFIDAFNESGYNLASNPIIYGQKHARVKRAIYILDTN